MTPCTLYFSCCNASQVTALLALLLGGHTFLSVFSAIVLGDTMTFMSKGGQGVVGCRELPNTVVLNLMLSYCSFVATGYGVTISLPI